MSQSVTLYPIDRNDFEAIEQDANNLELLSNRNDYVTFCGTHEGLRFVLSKALALEEVNLINEIFSPTTFIGYSSVSISPDSEEANEYLDVTDNEDYDDFEREPVFFLNPNTIQKIALLIDTISPEKFLSEFDPDELNTQDIYPVCWMKGNEKHSAYNEKHILEDFQQLKSFFTNVSQVNNYVLCFVG